MIVVSGCPRSGTSLTMDLIATAIGEDRIVGRPFPQAERIEAATQRRPGETDAAWRCRLYANQETYARARAEATESRDLNPHGFWEHPRYTVTGIQWADPAPPADAVCKIVSAGLARSNPAYVDRIVYLIRDPAAVARSQERLRRGVPFAGRAGRPIDQRQLRVNSPAAYIADHAAAARWILRHARNRPIHRVDFDKLIAQPEPQVSALIRFVDDAGDVRAAVKRVDRKLRRSHDGQAGDDSAWKTARTVYAALRRGDWQAVVDAADQHAAAAGNARPFRCTRWGGIVTAHNCRLCLSDPTVRANMRRTATRRGVDWRREPCLWACGMDPHATTPLTFDQSIAANHWVEPEALPAPDLGDTTPDPVREGGCCGPPPADR